MTAILTLHNPTVSKRYYDAGYWQQHTLYDLLTTNAQRRPDRYALRDSARRMTWRELHREVDLLAAQLNAMGVKPGERISVWLPNRVERIIVTLACSRNGYVCNPSLHQSYTVAEVKALLQRTNSKVLFAQAGFGADANRADIFQAASDIPALKQIYRLGPIEPSIRFEAAVHAADPRARGSGDQLNDPDKIVLLAFTSGSTGEPKGVMHSDNTLLANARAMARDWRHEENMILLCLSPLTHAIGTIAMAQSLVSGFELVLNDLPKGKSVLDWLLETQSTYVMGVPTHAIDTLAEAERRNIERIGNVRIFYMGGAAIPRQTVESLLARGITPQNVYGMTENGAHHYTRPDDDLQTMVESCGRDCGCYEVKIWDQEDADREMPQGEIGEIGGRGACLMLGYFADQAASESAMNQTGWFMTGDLGRIDARGNLQMVGRKKDIIIRGGRNIYPARIEDAARSHPAVLQAAAFPVADQRLGEKVAIAVVTRHAKSVTAEELLSHLSENGISRQNMPEYFAVLESMPLTPSGKLFKRGLLELVQRGKLKLQGVHWKG
jgi:acyl-CoA synthetase